MHPDRVWPPAPQPDAGQLDRVSPREREVLALLGEHLTHEQIAARLFLSVRTVESHVASLRRKLGLADHRALVRFAVGLKAARPVEAVAPPTPLTSFVGRQAELAAITRRDR